MGGASLAGAGVMAGTAGVVGAGTGAIAQGVEDVKKGKQVKAAEESAFMDGVDKGKEMAVEQVKKFADFCLATTALSFWIARCDGEIDEAEMLEIEYDLDSIKKNIDLDIYY